MGIGFQWEFLNRGQVPFPVIIICPVVGRAVKVYFNQFYFAIAAKRFVVVEFFIVARYANHNPGSGFAEE